MYLQTAGDVGKVCWNPPTKRCLEYFSSDFSSSPHLSALAITWNLSVLLSMFDNMEVVCGGLRSYSHARKVPLKQISRKQ